MSPHSESHKIKKFYHSIIFIFVLSLTQNNTLHADPIIPSDNQNKKGELRIPSEDLAKRNEHAKEVLLEHNKHYAEPTPSPVPSTAPPGSPPNPGPSSSAPGPAPSNAPFPEPVPLFSPPTKSTENDSEKKKASTLITPLSSQELSQEKTALPLKEVLQKDQNISSNPLKKDAQNITPQALSSPGNALPGDTLKSGLAKTNDTNSSLAQSGAAQTLEQKSKAEENEANSKQSVDTNVLAIKAKRLDPSQRAGLKDQRIAGVVVYNNYTSDISSLMAGEVGIVCDSTYYFARFSNEESKKISKGMNIKAYLSNARELEGEILWKGELETVS